MTLGFGDTEIMGDLWECGLSWWQSEPDHLFLRGNRGIVNIYAFGAYNRFFYFERKKVIQIVWKMEEIKIIP